MAVHGCGSEMKLLDLSGLETLFKEWLKLITSEPVIAFDTDVFTMVFFFFVFFLVINIYTSFNAGL